MVVKSETENRTSFSTLPPVITAYENDAVSARFAIIKQTLKKKQEPPRFPGGIWDINDDMDTTESLVDANRDSYREQLKTMLQLESPYLEIEDMDTLETCRSDNLSFGKSSLPEVLGARELGKVKMFAVPKKEHEKLKKKSTEESSFERFKRCRTSSKTEVYPLKPPFDDIYMESGHETQAKMLTKFLPFDDTTSEPIRSDIEKHLFQTQELNSLPMCKESQIVINDNKIKTDEGTGSTVVIKRENVYQQEINVLRRIAIIFESLGTNNNDEHKSYSEEVGHLKRICLVLKHLENNSHSSSKDILEVKKDTKSASGDVEGEVAFTALNEIHCDEYQSTELPYQDNGNSKDNSQPVKNEYQVSVNQNRNGASVSQKVEKGKPKSSESSADSNKKSDNVSVNNQAVNSEILLDKSSEMEASGSEKEISELAKIINGTLPWKPIGRPPPATAFNGSSAQSTNVSNALHSSIVQSSISSANGRLPQTSIDEILRFKANAKCSTVEQSGVRPMDADSIFENFVDGSLPCGPRGSPPPIAAFTRSTSSPSRSMGITSFSQAQDSPLKKKALSSANNTCMETSLPSEIRNEKAKDDLVALPDEASLNFPKQNVAMDTAAEEKFSLTNGSAPLDLDVEIGKVSSNEAIEKVQKEEFPWKQNEQIVETTEVLLPSHNILTPLLSRTSKSVLELNSVNSVPSFKAKAPHNRFYSRSSSKTPDAFSPYQTKERKSTEVKDPVKDNVTMKDAVLPSSPPRYIPPHLRSKSSAMLIEPTKLSWRSDNDVSRNNQQAQGFKTSAWSNWRKDKSPPPQQHDLGSTRHNIDQESQMNGTVDKFERLPPNDRKVMNLNVKMDNSSSRSNPSEYLDANKLNRTVHDYDKRLPPNDKKVLNIDVKMEKSAYESKQSQDAMISLKIFDEQNAVLDELTLPCNQLDQRRKLFPTLSEVVPSTGEKDKVLMMSGNAVKVFLRCVFPVPALKMPSWEIALEAYYLAKKYGIVKLQDQCKDYFDFKAIHSNQVQDIVQIARKFGITDVLKNSTMFAEVQAHKIPPDSTMPATTKEQQCTVSCTVSADPSEFWVPLIYIKEKGLGSRREVDIKNDIIFEAKSGTFCLTGLQIKLEAESSDLGKEVSILCDVFKSKKVFDLERVKKLNKLMIIDFKQRLLVEPGESATISVLMEDACMRMCHCLTKDKEFGRCADGSFEITFESDKKSEAKQPLFFVEKLLYTFEGRKY